MNKFSDGARRPFEWVEIDQPVCSRVYGVAPCTASLSGGVTEKCFNTRATCQDAANYLQDSVKTLRFCHNQSNVPDDYNYFPLLESASIGAAKLNPGGGNSNMSALGTRGSLSVSFSDAPSSDFIVDPYLSSRNYNPLTVGSFWSKWRARNPYYMHRVIRYCTGFIGADGNIDTETQIKRTFFITSFNGLGNDGSVSIQARDVLTLAANEKSTAPAASTGVLLATISAAATSLTLTPAGVGNLEYPASGKIRIGREVIAFTRVADVMTLTRAQNNTLADEQEAGSVVQLCKIYGPTVGERPHDIIFDLLVNYSGVPPEYIDYDQWVIEADKYLPRLYNTILTSPVGVSTLISEICEQMYLTLFWDDRESLLKLRAVRQADGDPVKSLTDFSNLLEGSTTWTDRADDLQTQIWIYYAQLDPTEKIDEPKNYAALEIVADLESETAERNGISKIKTIFSRWIAGANGGAAVELGGRILTRYSAIPREVNFLLDAKDGALWLADFISIQNRNAVDFYGNPVDVPMQITSASETVQGSIFSYTAIEYLGASYREPDELTVILSTDQDDVNLRAVFEQFLQITPEAGMKIRFIIAAGVAIGSDSGTYNSDFALAYKEDAWNYFAVVNTDTFNLPVLTRRDFTDDKFYAYHATAGIVDGDTYYEPTSGLPIGPVFCDIFETPCKTSLKTGDWPSGVSITLEIEPGAKILGHGGAGACHAVGDLNDISSFLSIPAGDGGHALDVTYPIKIKNSGMIGGGGGGGQSALAFFVFGGFWAGGGSGAGKKSLFSSRIIENTGFPFSPGKPGSYTLGGAGGDFFTSGVQAGSKGGDVAMPGVIGVSGDGYQGKAGYAVKSGGTLIEWVGGEGDIRGTINA